MILQYVASGLVLIATGWVWSRVGPVTREGLGRRERRRVTRRMFFAVGIWQWTIGLVLVSMHAWSGAPALFLMGLVMIFWSRHPWMVGAE